MQVVRTALDVEKLQARLARPVSRHVVRPVADFLRGETGSASLLLLATAIALVWANLSFASYERVWETTVSIHIGPLDFEEDARHIVNDLLMAIFFYVIALEVKRELVFGALRDRRSAALPAAAALGTMVGAALTYLTVNVIRDGNLNGWAIPIATDIAFAVGVLGLAGRRAPRDLRAFLLTLAVVDDIGTIAVIGLFFSTGIALGWLGLAAAIVIALLLAQRAGIRSRVLYGTLAAALWLAVFESGVHATIAGVILGFLTPAVLRHAGTGAEPESRPPAGAKSEGREGEKHGPDQERSPLVRFEKRLSPWSNYAILPIFALANAGVVVSAARLADSLTAPIGQGIFLGLVVGAPIVGFGFAWGMERIRLGRLPDSLDWPAVAGIAPLKGIGFTVAIFIATLAFDERSTQEEAKLAILAASALSAAIGLTVLYVRAAAVNRSRRTPGTA
jgi:NhaA family Na+:H+ antiporter